MATLVGNAKYGPGHKIILKTADQLSSTTKSKFTKEGYSAGKSVFSLVTSSKTLKIFKTIDIAPGKDLIYLKDDKSRIVIVRGSASSINGSFNHFSENSKSNTGILTEVKENISMEIFKEYFERNKILTENECMQLLGTQQKFYDTTYYQSAIKQLAALKKNVKGKGFFYERQGKNLTAKVYEVARKLTKKSNDNWNPADVWMIKKTFKMDPLYKAETVDELNGMIAKAYKKGDIIPISLKQVTAPNAKFAVIDPDSMMNMKLDIDLSFAKVDLSDTFANFIVQTQSGFAVRCGFKASASTLNVSLEGRFIGAGYQLGAVDAKTYAPHIKTNYKYEVRSGVGVSDADMLKAKNELKQIFEKYSRISNTLNNYNDAIRVFNGSNELTRKRFANLISYLYSFMIAPKNPKEFRENMQYCYFSSKKITTGSCLYVILQ
jgi:hypothetical protein